MRRFAVFLSIFIVTNTRCQDTLREVATWMYSMEYILYPDNHFESEFHHCNGVTYGRGSYDLRWRKIVFTYDSIPEQQLSVTCINTSFSDSLDIITLNAYDSSACETCSYFSGNKLIVMDTNQFSVSLLNDTLTVKCAGKDEQTIYLDSRNCSVYELYLPAAWVSYSSPDKTILKRESKNLYSKTYVNWDENAEKPWRKGKKRKGKNYYTLIKK